MLLVVYTLLLQNYFLLFISPSRITFTTLLLTHFRAFFVCLYQKEENGNHLLEKICIFAVLKLKTMVDDNKVFIHSAEMAKHARGVAQFMDSLVGGQFVTKEQVNEAMDFLLASTKRNIESNPNATRQEKDAEIRRKEFLMNMLKQQMGI